MLQPDLKELIRKCKSNNMHAFRELVEMHQGAVFTFAFRMLCNEDEAKDAVQETFIRVWKHIGNYNTDLKFSTWLFAIASNLCCDRLRSRKRHQFLEPLEQNKIFISLENIEAAVINSDLAKIIYALTDKLTPKQKLIFTLRDLQGFETEEIEKITGMTPGKIKSNLYLARQFIRQQLEKI